MARDQFGNYVVDVQPAPYVPGTSSSHGILFIDGVPDNGDGHDGDVWANRITGTVYEKVDGIWVPRILSGGAGAVAQVIAGPFSDPNGNISPADLSKAAFYYQEPISLLNVWQWSVNDQQWEQYSG